MKNNPKKPEKIEDHKCPDCGGETTTYYYGLDSRGNEDYRTTCKNRICPSNRKSQHLGQFEVFCNKYSKFSEWMTARDKRN